MGAELTLVALLLVAGALLGFGAGWVVFNATSGKPAWSRALRAVAVLLGCAIAPVIFFIAMGFMAKLFQSTLKASSVSTWQVQATTASRETQLRASRLGKRTFSWQSSQHRRGDHGVVAPEIFWKARGDHGWFAAAAIACVFKKFTG
jgi:hypothetical protein